MAQITKKQPANVFAAFASATTPQEGVELNIIGTVGEALEVYPQVNLFKSGNGLVLLNEDRTEMLSLGFSKALSAELAKGAIKLNQLGNLNIISGTNKDGEERRYIVLPSEYKAQLSSEMLVGGEVPKQKTVNFTFAQVQSLASGV